MSQVLARPTVPPARSTVPGHRRTRSASIGSSRAWWRSSTLLVALVMAWLSLAPTVAAQGPKGSSFGRWGLSPEVMARMAQFPEVGQDVYGEPIAEIRFRGNRRVESEAMLLELSSKPGLPVSTESLGADLRRLWALGYFEDVFVEGEMTTSGVVLTYTVKERPTIRKIIVEGNDKIKLDKINEVLDLAKNEVLELGKLKSNVEKVKALYTQEGFFLADVTYAVRPVEDEPGKVDVAIVVSEASEVIVRGITFVGNSAFSDKELQKAMFTRIGGYFSVFSKKSGGVYNRDALLQDYNNLRAYYADFGYLDAKLGDPELALSPDRRFVYITIDVDEGPQYTIGDLRAREIVGRGEKPLYSEKILAESIDPVLRVGDVASMGKIREIMQDIELRYKNQGYAYVNVIPDTRQDRDNLKLYVFFQVQKGPLVYIERINILGNDRTADKVIRREIPIVEGSLYSESAKEIAEINVLRLGYFSEANVSTSRGTADDKIVINVEVTERLTGTFQVGAGFSTIENFVLQAQIQYDNFLGRGATVSLVAQVSSLRRLFNFRYFTRHFLDSQWQFDVNLFNSSNIFPSFSRDSTGFSMQWGYPLPRLPNLVFWAGYNFEWVRVGTGGFTGRGGIFSPGALVTVPEQALISNLFADGITSALTARVVYDTRDNFLFPTKGMFHQLRGQFALKQIGSQNEYQRYDLDSRFYFPIIKTERPFRAWMVFKTRLQVGYIWGPTKRGVPIFERYFPGGMFGAGSIRGYRLRTLGPRITVQSSPDPTSPQLAYEIGGNLLTALNVELEFMLVPPANIKGVLFMDVGNAFNTERQYCTELDAENRNKADPCVPIDTGAADLFRDLRVSMGFGFRWQSPIGPLRFEWGFPLDRQPRTPLNLRGDDPVVFEFNVGTGF